MSNPFLDLKNELRNLLKLLFFLQISATMDQAIESRNPEIEMQATASSCATTDQQNTFVVENLEGRIRDTVKQSSMQSDESRTSMQSISNSLVPDADVLISLENYAKTISTNIDVLLRDLRGSLKGFYLKFVIIMP